MTKYREICSKFSCIDGFEGWVIARIELICHCEKNNDMEFLEKKSICGKCMDEKFAEIVKKKKRFAVLEADGMRMYLIKPETLGGDRKQKKEEHSDNAEKCMESDKKKSYGNRICKKLYTKDDIIRFTDDVKDYNPIHRVEKPIVPGLLMLETLLESDFMSEYVKSITITFEKPLFSDEILYIYDKTDDEIKNETDKRNAEINRDKADIYKKIQKAEAYDKNHIRCIWMAETVTDSIPTGCWTSENKGCFL